MGVTIRRYAITGGLRGMATVSLPRANKLGFLIGWMGKGLPAGSAMGGNGPIMVDIPYLVGLYIILRLPWIYYRNTMITLSRA